MLGIADFWISAAYLLCVSSVVLCVSYGLYNWNRGNEKENQEVCEVQEAQEVQDVQSKLEWKGKAGATA